jgi:hypothetical protein
MIWWMFTPFRLLLVRLALLKLRLLELRQTRDKVQSLLAILMEQLGQPLQ